MLYIFHVDAGRMIKFDMNIALSSVQNLKDIIQRDHGLPAANIVLLVSGGEMLVPNSLVCGYSAGTDTNPIYMFSTVDIKTPWPSIEPGHFCDDDFSNKVDSCLSLPATFQTVVARAKLAQELYEAAKEELLICESFVHDQHLQQQGWSAVIANMEDLTEEFRQRFENFSRCFDRYLVKRPDYLELLHNFNEDLMKLSKIPILPGLLHNAEGEFHGFDAFLENDEVFAKSQQVDSVIMKSVEIDNKNEEKKDTEDGSAANEITSKENVTSSSSGGLIEQKRPRLSKENTPEIIEDKDLGTNKHINISANCNLTLLQWISAKENANALQIMAEECIQGLNTFDIDTYERLKHDVKCVIDLAEQEDIKEIKGLEDRLSGLEKLMFNLRKLCQDQKELATAFQQNQVRAGTLGDASVLPDLCDSHRSQLIVMMTQHKQARDYRRRVSKAKDELGANLNKRLRYIVHIENTMSDLDNRLLFYHRCQRRVERHLNIIFQIHQTPIMYFAAVSEVVRRRIFSGEFLRWASNLASDFDIIHDEEVVRRRKFNDNFSGHFLNTLFPGMNDMPPAFANENPLIFDADLPVITKNDIDVLSSYLPDISKRIQLPDMETVIDFFTTRSGSKVADEKMLSSSSRQQQRIQFVSARAIDLHAHLKDDLESETDTEEFEKVGGSNEKIQQKAKEKCMKQSVATSTTDKQLLDKLNISIETEPIPTRTVETSTEDKFDKNEEIEKLKILLKNMSQITNESIKLLRNNLQSLKSDQANNKTDIQGQVIKLSETWNIFEKDYDLQIRSKIDGLKETHQTELNRLISTLHSKQMQLDALQIEFRTNEASQCKQLELYEIKLNELRGLCDKLQLQIDSATKNHEIEMIKLRETLTHEHKTEIESLRCRFKLMTSMERSPSDTSLEKIEKPQDMIDIHCHESILMQTREDFLAEKEEAIREAIEMEKLKWEENAVQNYSVPSLAISANLDLLKKMIEEKDKQLDQMRERDLVLSKENCQLKMRIESLTNEEESDKGWLKEKIEFLNRDKNRLEQELSTEKLRRIEMETSVATMRTSTMEGVSGVMSRSRLSSSQSFQTPSSSQHRQFICTDSCSKGDIVLVVWNIRHQQFIIVQESHGLYFVHGDSVTALNLNLPLPGDKQIPVPFYAIGRVYHKEYCQARKDENRYKVTKGSKFYRVKLQSVSEFKWHNRRERIEHPSNPSTSVSRSTSTQHLIDSFSQTEQHLQPSTSYFTRDMVDSISLKERTIREDGENVDGEDTDDVSLLSDRCRNISMSEEEENVITESAPSQCTDFDVSIALNSNVSTNTNLQSDDEYRSLESKEELFTEEIEEPMATDDSNSTLSSEKN